MTLLFESSLDIIVQSVYNGVLEHGEKFSVTQMTTKILWEQKWYVFTWDSEVNRPYPVRVQVYADEC